MSTSSNQHASDALTLETNARTWLENCTFLTPSVEIKKFVLHGISTEASFEACEYDGGTVDWYTFDRSSTALAGGSVQPVKSTRHALVSPVTFRGMPVRRFWELEDASVDIGALTAGAEDLGRLLLREFALIYGNDWFQVPLAVPVGSDVSIDSLVVADTFGRNTTIPHYAQVDGAAVQWRMFSTSNFRLALDVIRG